MADVILYLMTWSKMHPPFTVSHSLVKMSLARANSIIFRRIAYIVEERWGGGGMSLKPIFQTCPRLN